jgi:hypothetical protein
VGSPAAAAVHADAPKDKDATDAAPGGGEPAAPAEPAGEPAAAPAEPPGSPAKNPKAAVLHNEAAAKDAAPPASPKAPAPPIVEVTPPTNPPSPTPSARPLPAPPGDKEASGQPANQAKAAEDKRKAEEDATRATEEAASLAVEDRRRAEDEARLEAEERRKEVEERRRLEDERHQHLATTLTDMRDIINMMLRNDEDSKKILEDAIAAANNWYESTEEWKKNVDEKLDKIVEHDEATGTNTQEGFDDIKRAFTQANLEMNNNLGERNVDLVGQISSKLEQTKDDCNLAKKEQIAFNVQN